MMRLIFVKTKKYESKKIVSMFMTSTFDQPVAKNFNHSQLTNLNLKYQEMKTHVIINESKQSISRLF